MLSDDIVKAMITEMLSKISGQRTEGAADHERFQDVCFTERMFNFGMIDQEQKNRIITMIGDFM